MKLTSIELTNFRSFRSASIGLHPNVTLFVGVNEAGKTTVLDAISIPLSMLSRHIQSGKSGGKFIAKYDVTSGQFNSKVVAFSDQFYYQGRGKDLRWSLSFDRNRFKNFKCDCPGILRSNDQEYLFFKRVKPGQRTLSLLKILGALRTS